jgi:hypothetical protein
VLPQVTGAAAVAHILLVAVAASDPLVFFVAGQLFEVLPDVALPLSWDSGRVLLAAGLPAISLEAWLPVMSPSVGSHWRGGRETNPLDGRRGNPPFVLARQSDIGRGKATVSLRPRGKLLLSDGSCSTSTHKATCLHGLDVTQTRLGRGLERFWRVIHIVPKCASQSLPFPPTFRSTAPIQVDEGHRLGG